MKNQT